MHILLKRNSLMDKKKKKKRDLDKIFSLIQGKMELDLKNLNKKSEKDFMTIDELNPSTFKFEISKEVKPLIDHFVKTLKEYVQVNNEYNEIKCKEEKFKTKKQKNDNI